MVTVDVVVVDFFNVVVVVKVFVVAEVFVVVVDLCQNFALVPP